MSLSGTTDLVPLDEVLRLLVKTKQVGCLRVTGGDITGRVFVRRGGVSLATTFTDGSLRSLLLKRGVAAEALRDVENRRTTFADLDQASRELATECLREITVESLYRVSVLEKANFDFVVETDTPYTAPEPFELESTLGESERRAHHWDEILRTVPDLDSPLQLTRDVGGRDAVTVDAASWRLLAGVGSGKSVRGLADSLGLTDFGTARIAAGLVEDGLLESQTARADDTAPEPLVDFSDFATDVASDETEGELAETTDREPDEFEPVEPLVFSEVTADHVPASEGEPAAVAEELDEDERDQDESREQDKPREQHESEVDPNKSWWEEPSAEEEEADEDARTEEFLEQVFSQLGTEDSREAGHGLLRRRRIGAALRDLNEND